MSDPISAILDLHDTPRTRNDSQGMLLSLAAEHPRQLGELMLQAVARRSPGSAFLDMALDLLPTRRCPRSRPMHGAAIARASEASCWPA
ncbi:hypothetical protein [Stenotrophomonas sp. NRRL B-14846]|uniref:hypothetical protein n=1 Tax=Stenotrophomonas sp. NRRL B-14846 TaxID=3162882 RepID=UPI003D2965D5